MSESKPIIFAFSGKSNSGKTTLICRICDYLNTNMQNIKIAIIKHDPKDKAIFDKEGKDSYKFFEKSSAVATISPKKSVIQIKNELDSNTLDSSLAESNLAKSSGFLSNAEKQAFTSILDSFKDYDFIFIEGLKSLPYPRIVLARQEIDSSYIPYADAFALDKNLDSTMLPKHIKFLDLDDIKGIVNYIINFKKG